VQVTGILLAFLDIPPEYTQEYNRWYDLDHLPEHISKADVLVARRYVAPRDLRDGDGALPAEALGGHAPYLTIYSFGVDDFAGDAALDGWRTKDAGIVRAGRYWRMGRGRYAKRWRLVESRACPSVLVSEEAVPYLAHRGVIVALGRAPSVEQRDGAVAWWANTHLVDLFAVPGVLGALRFDPLDAADQDQVLHVLLLGDDPALVMARIGEALRYQNAVGRYPAYGGVYEPIAFLPYRSIVPFEYDFEL
jgi:hypothetical protein